VLSHLVFWTDQREVCILMGIKTREALQHHDHKYGVSAVLEAMTS